MEVACRAAPELQPSVSGSSSDPVVSATKALATRAPERVMV